MAGSPSAEATARFAGPLRLEVDSRVAAGGGS